MKFKISVLVLAGILLSSLFFTACEQEELVQPTIEKELSNSEASADTSKALIGSLYLPLDSTSSEESLLESRSCDPLGISGKAYFIKIRRSGKYLDIAGGSLYNNGNLQQHTYNGGYNQIFRFRCAGDGSYYIQNVRSGLYLDIVYGSTANNANVQQYRFHGGDNQRFFVSYVGSGYYRIKNKKSGKCLDLVNGTLNNGGNIQQYTCHSGDNQQFALYRAFSRVGSAFTYCPESLTVDFKVGSTWISVRKNECRRFIKLPYAVSTIYWACGGVGGNKVTNSRSFTYFSACRNASGHTTWTFYNPI